MLNDLGSSLYIHSCPFFCFLQCQGGITFTHIAGVCLYELLMSVESLFHGNQVMIIKLAGSFSKMNWFCYKFFAILEKYKDIMIYYEVNTSWEQIFNIRIKMKIIVSIKLLETTTHFILGILYNSLGNEIINKKIPQAKSPRKS